MIAPVRPAVAIVPRPCEMIVEDGGWFEFDSATVVDADSRSGPAADWLRGALGVEYRRSGGPLPWQRRPDAPGWPRE